MITNQNASSFPFGAEETVIYRAKAGGRTYSHHAGIAEFRDRLYAMWSSGKVNEDDRGQCVMAAVSLDGLQGKMWSDPFPLFPEQPDGAVLTAAGFYVHGDTLNAYAGRYCYRGGAADPRPTADAEHLGTTLLVKTTGDGEHWSDAVDLHVPIIPNLPPRRLESGRLMLCGNVTFPVTDDPTGLSGWQVRGLSPCPVEGLQDDSEGFHLHDSLRKDGFSVCEGSFFERDGIIRMLLRNTRDHLLCLSESRDGGESWSPPTLTDFTDNNSKFDCLTLPDGRVLIVSNPEQKEPRCPLAISISDDGEHFDRRYLLATEPRPRRFAGMYKGGVYGYPEMLLTSEGILFVICSVNKEDITTFRVPILTKQCKGL